MKIVAFGSDLNFALKKIKPFINFKGFQDQPLMRTVKITVSDCDTRIEATDWDKTIRVKLPPLSAPEPGELCIGFKELQQAVKGQKDLVTITDNEIICNHVPIRFEPFSAKDFESPFPENPPGAEKEYILTQDFIEGLSSCLPYVSVEDSRPAFTGVWITQKKLIASDTHALILCERCGVDHNKDAVVPANSVKAIVETFKKHERVFCHVTDKFITVTDKCNFTVVSRLLETRIPPFEQIVKSIPRTINFFYINPKEFLEVLNTIPAERPQTVIQLNLDIERGVSLQTGKVRAFPLQCRPFVVENMQVLCNLKYLKRLASTFLDNEEIAINFTGANSFVTAVGETITTLFLPIRKER